MSPVLFHERLNITGFIFFYKLKIVFFFPTEDLKIMLLDIKFEFFRKIPIKSDCHHLVDQKVQSKATFSNPCQWQVVIKKPALDWVPTVLEIDFIYSLLAFKLRPLMKTFPMFLFKNTDFKSRVVSEK